MAKRGRPVKGEQLVDGVADASAVAGQRLRVILQTLAGALSIQDACAALGVGRSAFHKLRGQFLARAAGLLEPRPRGHRHREPTDAEQEVQRLRQQIVQLKLDLRAQQIREEIALVMPHLIRAKGKGKRPAGVGKKTPRRARPGGTRSGSTGSHR